MFNETILGHYFPHMILAGYFFTLCTGGLFLAG